MPMLRINTKKSKLVSQESADFAARNALLDSTGANWYPLLSNRKQSSVIRVPQFISKFANFVSNDQPQQFTVQGRINSIRKSGKRLTFIDLVQDGFKLQVMVNKSNIDGEMNELLRRGDQVSCMGVPWRSKSGELSISARHPVELVSPCLHPLPTNLQDEVTRMHNRVVDMAVNPQLQTTIKVRSTTMQYIRQFFESRQFTEVNTPIISSQAGGAAATPFSTTSTALDTDGKSVGLALRIAPELWLKRLVIGGLEKVYEIGPCFRNEGIDATHNPEFYTCEFYQSFITLDDLIATTEELLRGVVDTVIDKHGSTEHLELLREKFAAGVKRIEYFDMEHETGPLPNDLTDESLRPFCRERRIDTDGGAAGMLDALAERYLEPLCQDQPTIIMNHPQIMSPLAKSATITINNRTRHVSKRFELFINGREYVNAYEEENSPRVQLANFRQQASSDSVVDQGYVDALEWGLPPTGGWGMGIDRLVMLLTNSTRIDQVLPFGTVKTVNYQ